MNKHLLSTLFLLVFFEGVSQQPSQKISNFEIIGQTIYDLQSYGSSRNAFYVEGTGEKGAVANSDLIVTPGALGTHSNYFDGLQWLSSGDTLTDLLWSNVGVLSNGTQIIVGYDSVNGQDLMIYSTSTPGMNYSGATIPANPNGNKSKYPRMAVGGNSGLSVHVIDITIPVSEGGTLSNGIDGEITYTRSQNGGAAWNIVHSSLPGINSSLYHSIKKDSYAIDVKDSIVAISQGSFSNDWAIWKSTDDGASWVKTVVKPFPFPAFNSSSMILDVNADGTGDTIPSVDGAVEVLVDNNGMVHVWGGLAYVYDNTIADTVNYLRESSGILYWNQYMGALPPVIIAQPFTTPNYLPLIAEYGLGAWSMPSAGIDIAGNIFLVFAAIVEGTNSGTATPQEYRDVFCIATKDNGLTWTMPFNISNDDFSEDVFPAMARFVDNDIHLLTQQDTEPGMGVTGDLDIWTDNFMICYNIPVVSILNSPVSQLSYPIYVQGQVYWDINANGVKDAGEAGLGYQKINRNPGNSLMFTLPNGIYTSNLFPSVNYQLSASPYANWMQTSSPPVFNILLTTSPSLGNDFGIDNAITFTNLEIENSGQVPQCWGSFSQYLNVLNTGSTTENVQVRFTFPPSTFASSNPFPDSVAGNIAYWNISGVSPFSSNLIQAFMNDTGNVPAGTPFFTIAEVFRDIGGSYVLFDSDTLSQLVTCSYDPNDKMVEPAGVQAQHYVFMNDTLYYTIRFQNTGTDTAFNVVIRDTIDSSHDLNTFEMIGSSYPANILIEQNGAALFRFENILLPDSNVNEPASHGYIKYRIRAKQNLPDPTVVYNTAYIYFDYNLPVVTNTVFSTLTWNIPSGIEQPASHNSIHVFPNPSSESVYVEMDKFMQGTFSFALFNAMGKEVLRKKIFASSWVDVSGCQQGFYFYSVEKMGGEKISSGKLIIH